jgi:hypothetical protein
MARQPAVKDREEERSATVSDKDKEDSVTDQQSPHLRISFPLADFLFLMVSAILTDGRHSWNPHP